MRDSRDGPGSDAALQSNGSHTNGDPLLAGASNGRARPVVAPPYAASGARTWPPYAAQPLTPAADTVDVVALARSIRGAWRTVLVGAALGLIVALALLRFYPPRYRAIATVLVRNGNDPTSGLLSRVGLPADLAASGAGLGSALKSPLETEIQLLESRDVLGDVVDSLGLQVRVLAPFGVPSRRLIAIEDLRGSFRHRNYTFQRIPSGAYRVEGDDTALVAGVGAPVTLPAVGRITLPARGGAPDRFAVQIEDREDAITRLTSQFAAEKEGGEVVSLSFAGPDSLTAADVPNAVANVYLARRRTVDRGYNQRRFEFLSAQADTVARQLAQSEDALRSQQEGSGVFDPEITGKTSVEALRDIRGQEVTADAERRAIRELVSGVQGGTLTARQLTAFPAFLRSPAINSILTQITQLEARRTDLLSRRTEHDPDVVVLTRSISDLEQQLLPLGRTYAAALDAQTSTLGRASGAIEQRLDALPRQAEGAVRRQRDVRRLSQTLLALQGQIIDARLAALGEGGQVRQVDVARPPKKRQFPQTVWTLLTGPLGGGFLGLVWVLVRTAASRRLLTSHDVESTVGAPVATLRPDLPLLLDQRVESGTLVVIPVDSARLDGGRAAAAAAVVAARLVEQSADRGVRGRLFDAAGGGDSTNDAPADVRALVGAEADRRHLTVVTTEGLESRHTLAVLDPEHRVVLVAVAGRTTRTALADAARAVERLSGPLVGVVLVPADERSSDRVGRRATRPRVTA